MKLLTDTVSDICETLIEKGFTLYLYGSSARKLLLKEKPDIFYLLTDADIVDLAQLFESVEFPGRADCDAELRDLRAIVRFRKAEPRDGVIDYPYLRSQSTFQMLTIDTFFYHLKRDVYLDPFSCYSHFQNRILAPTPYFQNIYGHEPFRIFDSLYLAGNHEFSLSRELQELLETHSFTCSDVHHREIQPGLSAVLTARKPLSGITLMDRYRILTAIIPELEPTRTVPQDKDHHPEGNVYEHTLECFKYIENPSLELALALLLHDVGKPSTARFINRDLRFPNHQKVGAQMARKILRRIGYESELINRVAWLIEYHLLTHELYHMKEHEKKKLMEHPLFPDLLKLFKADVSSCYGDLSVYYKIISAYRRIKT